MALTNVLSRPKAEQEDMQATDGGIQAFRGHLQAFRAEAPPAPAPGLEAGVTSSARCYGSSLLLLWLLAPRCTVRPLGPEAVQQSPLCSGAALQPHPEPRCVCTRQPERQKADAYLSSSCLLRGRPARGATELSGWCPLNTPPQTWHSSTGLSAWGKHLLLLSFPAGLTLAHN